MSTMYYMDIIIFESYFLSTPDLACLDLIVSHSRPQKSWRFIQLKHVLPLSFELTNGQIAFCSIGDLFKVNGNS